jgi:hypothetical protein
MKKLLWILLVALSVSSCKKGIGKKIPVNEMKIIMWDMVCADELYADASVRDSTVRIKKDNFRLYEQVFAIHKISKETFYSSYQYYQSRPDEFKVLMDSLQSYGSRQRNRPVKPALKNLAQ